MSVGNVFFVNVALSKIKGKSPCELYTSTCQCVLINDNNYLYGACIQYNLHKGAEHKNNIKMAV